jgi:hypothetical protein
MSWIMSSSCCVVLSLTSVAGGIILYPLSYIWDACIRFRTCLNSNKSFLILPLWFSNFTYSYVAWSCTLSVTRLASSSTIVYSGIFLWALAFLHGPPVCMIEFLGVPVSCELVFDGVPYVIVSPLSCSSCVGALSLFFIFLSFFGVLPFFCCVSFGPGFTCCVGFLVTSLSLVDVLDDHASTSFPLGMSLVMTRIFQSSFQSFISHSNSFALMQNRSCSHYFYGSLCTWIHILCHIALKLAIPWYCVTTS